MNMGVNWRGYQTIVRKEVTRILRIWAQTVVPPAITMTLYFIIFGNLIGRRIGDMGGFGPSPRISPRTWRERSNVVTDRAPFRRLRQSPTRSQALARRHPR